jgi:Response regulator containing CheY-like receiver, AAA-type ATPase, and DNA-binding domains
MRLLIVGHLAGQVTAASQIAIRHGAEVVHADDLSLALRVLRAGQGIQLVLIDVALDVAALTQALTAERISVPVIACGIATDTRAAIAAIRGGAREYLPLPPDADMIGAILAAIAEEATAIVHADPRMAELLTLAERVAATEASVLISGESGTGKEVLARRLHAHSRRSRHPFVAVNCAAIPEALLESELFGHEKGAFTGAVARRIGRFEEANGGTLLLDEITEMDLRLQPKLLRAIQERTIDRVGGTAPQRVDVRIIATSNRDLEEEVARGRFRRDLYFRLNVVALTIPPLRERPGDILALARHFVDRYADLNGISRPSLSDEAQRTLIAHGWPGNVRELENAVHRAVVLASGPVIGVADLPPAVVDTPTQRVRNESPAPVAPATLVGKTVADVERDLILDTLSHCLGNRTHAASILGISIRTLRNKLRQYGSEGTPIPPPPAGQPVTQTGGSLRPHLSPFGAGAY